MLVKSPDPRSLLNQLIAWPLSGKRVSVLEAGGGSRSVLDSGAIDIAEITTIDIDGIQLERNTYADMKIQGDLQEYRYDRTYDLVVIYNVLEHLDKADRALANLRTACGPGSLIVVGSPNEYSFSGFVTRFTPHWFHVAFYRYVRGNPDAGRPGHAPFPTHYHPATRPGTLRKLMESAGFECLHLATYTGGAYSQARRNQPLFWFLLMTVTSVINVFLPKDVNCRHGDYHAVFRKPEEPPSGE